ncbi:PAS domain-containing sensor histidine kinase [Haloarchaeobius amylolyticus]|uniref:histidine kinase n=1 Tax=Haloarchaeobius amylolyticus TaxID=1198296 RepID=A0ABD6BDY4_9EURY
MSRQSRHRYEAICETSPDAILLIDGDGRITYANARVTDLFGYEPSELVGKPIEILVPESVRDAHVAQRDAYIADPAVRPMGVNLELSGQRKDGTEIPVDISLSPIETDGQREFMAAVRDVSEQRALRTKYQTILEAVPDAVLVADAATGEIIEANRQVADLTGYEPDEIVGEPQTALHPSGEEPSYRELFANHVGSGQSIFTQFPDGSDIYVETKDGEQVPVEINAHTFELQDQQLIAGAFRDVTARKEYERQLQALHTATRWLMEADDSEEIARLVADAARTILGYEHNVVRLVDDTHLRPVAVTESAETEMGARPDYPVDGDSPASRAYRRGESIRYDDVRSLEDDYDRGEAHAAMYLPLGDHGVISIVDPDAGAFDQSDEDLAFVLSLNAEIALNRLAYEQELERQNERLDEFASVVAHDLRNPLNVAQGLLATAQTESDLEHGDELDDVLDRMAGIIDDVLTMVRCGYDLESVDELAFGDVVTSCWDTVATGNASLQVASDGRFYADSSRIRNLFENLFRNAVEHGSTSPPSQARQDAVERSSTSPDSQARQDAVERSSTSPDSQARQDAVERSSTSPDSQARQDAVEHGGDGVTVTVGLVDDGFYVGDDGPGIPPDERDRVLEPGWTTNADGTGLGLNIVREIAQAHGWDVDVTESAAGGARFEFSGVRTAVGDESVTPPS